MRRENFVCQVGGAAAGYWATQLFYGCAQARRLRELPLAYSHTLHTHTHMHAWIKYQCISFVIFAHVFAEMVCALFWINFLCTYIHSNTYVYVYSTRKF